MGIAAGANTLSTPGEDDCCLAGNLPGGETAIVGSDSLCLIVVNNENRQVWGNGKGYLHRQLTYAGGPYTSDEKTDSGG